MKRKKGGKTTLNRLQSKKGISGIVATLIIVLLTIAAVAIIWVVLQGLLDRGSSQIEIKTKCLDTSIDITKVACEGALCNITVTRETGEAEIGGIDIVFENTEGTQSSDSFAIVEGNLKKLQLATVTGYDTGLETPGKVKAQVYFLDDSENKQSCDSVTEREISTN